MNAVNLKTSTKGARAHNQMHSLSRGRPCPYVVGNLLLNSMARALRRCPMFPVYGRGDFPVQLVYAEDLAGQAVEVGSQSESPVADAAGPATFSFEALLHLLAASMGVRRGFLHTPSAMGLALTGLVGLLKRDVVLTRDEVDGVMARWLTG